jgi:cyanophycin synthetase
LSAEIYDEVIIRIDDDTRGRKPEEIISLIKKGINSVKPDLPCKVIPDTKEAILDALHHSKPGSYIVVNADHAQKTLQIVKEIKEELEVV